jgi:hypothetical protein
MLKIENLKFGDVVYMVIEKLLRKITHSTKRKFTKLMKMVSNGSDTNQIITNILFKK